MSALDIANEASEKLCDQADWLVDAIKSINTEEDLALALDSLLVLAEHVSAESWRTATLCALAKAEHG